MGLNINQGSLHSWKPNYIYSELIFIHENAGLKIEI
jgi:hypothetical protein